MVSLVCCNQVLELNVNSLSLYGPTAVQPQSVSVYQYGVYQYQGCYTDSPSDRVLTGRQWFDNDMTLEMCASWCYTYEYFGTEFETQCFCGSSITGSQQVPDSECTSSCPGNIDEYCVRPLLYCLHPS